MTAGEWVDRLGESSREWTKGELDREHPIPDWEWVAVDAVGDHWDDKAKWRKPFGDKRWQARHPSWGIVDLKKGRLHGENPVPWDVAQAVILVSKGKGSLELIEKDRDDARRAHCEMAAEVTDLAYADVGHSLYPGAVLYPDQGIKK